MCCCWLPQRLELSGRAGRRRVQLGATEPGPGCLPLCSNSPLPPLVLSPAAMYNQDVGSLLTPLLKAQNPLASPCSFCIIYSPAPTLCIPLPAGPATTVYFSSQFSPLIIFFLMFLSVVKNKKLHHFVRFNCMQASAAAKHIGSAMPCARRWDSHIEVPLPRTEAWLASLSHKEGGGGRSQPASACLTGERRGLCAAAGSTEDCMHAHPHYLARAWWSRRGLKKPLCHQKRWHGTHGIAACNPASDPAVLCRPSCWTLWSCCSTL